MPSAGSHPLIGCLDLVVTVAAPEHLPAAGRDQLAAPPVVLAAELAHTLFRRRLHMLNMLQDAADCAGQERICRVQPDAVLVH